MPERTCSVDGCCAPHRARGLCSTHYNQQRQPNRHRKSTVKCGHCGKATLKHVSRRYADRFCSFACRDAWREATGNNPAPPGKSQCMVPWRTCPDCGIDWFRHGSQRERCDACLSAWLAARRAKPRPVKPRSVAGWCRRCGTAFIDRWYAHKSAVYCSLRCTRKDGKARHRARKRDAYVANVSAYKIYERDGWRCKLCGKRVRRDQVVPAPLAPVIDHVVPLAQGGTHEPANVQCAHFMCNSIKGDRMATAVQLALM